MRAAFLYVKLAVFDEWNACRREIATQYSKILAGADMRVPVIPEYAEPVWHPYVIRSKHRDALKVQLARQGVATVIHYPTPLQQQACYQDFKGHNLPIAVMLAEEVLNLPISPIMGAEELVVKNK